MDINDNLVKKIYNEKAATYSDIDSVLDVKNPRANAFHHFLSVNAIHRFLKFKFDEKKGIVVIFAANQYSNNENFIKWLTSKYKDIKFILLLALF